MTLDEAIKHAEEVAEEQENKFSTSGEYLGNNADCKKCAEEHRQLAEWLKDYKRLLDQQPITSTNNDEPITVIYPTIVCDDAIRREDALKLIYDFKEKHTEDREKHPINYGTLLDLIRLIRELPSVTHKSGKWITDRCDMYICSKCNHTYTDLSGERYGMNFCPNCGAKMVEPQESEE